MNRTERTLAEFGLRESRVARLLAAAGLADACPVVLPASALERVGGDLADPVVMRPTMHPASGRVTQHNSPRVARPTEGSL